MDYALTKYGEAFVGDVKALFKVSEIQPNKIGGFYNSLFLIFIKLSGGSHVHSRDLFLGLL